MPAAFGRRVLMPMLMKFLGTYPELSLSATFSDTIIDPIAEGVDLVVRFGDTEDCSGLISRKLVEQGRVIIAAPSYLARKGRPERIEDLNAHQCIVGLRGSTPTQWVVNDGSGELVRISPPPTHKLNDGDAMLAAVLAGHGLAQMPSFLVRTHVGDGCLVPVLQPFSTSSIPVYALWPKTRHLSPKIRLFIDELVDRAAAGDLD